MSKTPNNQQTIPILLRPQELEAVYAISKAVAGAEDLDAALDEIVRLSRPVFIFDNIVLYLQDQTINLEPVYARVIGRGRSAEADLAWGESVAVRVCQKGELLTDYEKLLDWEQNRLNLRYMLGLPLSYGDDLIGAIVFGRFGGPEYTAEQVHLAEFIALHISQLLRRMELVERIGGLEAERRLQQLQGNFIAAISHELHTPLGFIKGYVTTLLRSDTQWDEKVRREFLTIVNEETNRLQELIDNLLDSSRLQGGTFSIKLQLLQMDLLLKDTISRLNVRYPDTKILLEIETGIWAQVDPLRLEQVLNNLISNSLKYAPGSPIWIDLKQEQENCQITVRDEGPGIPLKHQSQIFNRFYRIPEAYPNIHGTGLGLYICREIVRAHNGEIWVESDKGHGAQFFIRLPLSPVLGKAF